MKYSHSKDRVKFNKETSFNLATFNKNVTFNGAEFSGEVEFLKYLLFFACKKIKQ
jgi:hypothetical protein